MAKQHTKPCDSCPFLVKNAGMIKGERAEEIAGVHYRDKHFYCHKTLDYSRGDGRMTDKTAICAGSMIVAERSDVPPSQMARISARIGMFDFEEIVNSDAECFESFDDFIEGHTVCDKR